MLCFSSAKVVADPRTALRSGCGRGICAMVARPPASPPSTSFTSARAPGSHDDTRQRLVMAAGQLIADGGISAASARAIAASAGTAPSAINYNFGNIERLLLTVFEQGVEETRAWL